SAAGIYAIGDLVHGPALAHKASDEGVIAVEDAAGLQTHPLTYIDIPRATFCTPNVGSFGLTEAQARDEGYDVVIGKVQYWAVRGRLADTRLSRGSERGHSGRPADLLLRPRQPRVLSRGRAGDRCAGRPRRPGARIRAGAGGGARRGPGGRRRRRPGRDRAAG